MSSSACAPSGWQAGFLQVMPAIQTNAAIQFRRLHAEQRAEATQEALAAACLSYHDLAVSGRLDVAYPSSLATYAVRHVRGGRHVGGRQDSRKDVMSPAAQRRFGFERLDRFSVDGGGWHDVLLSGARADIPSLAAFRI